MRFLLSAVLISGLFLLPNLVILAQSGPASVSIALQMQTGHPYKTGSPFCATKEYLPIETPPNGSKVGHTVRICRDSLGRGREELEPTLIEIYDPVERVGYTLDTVHRRAGRTMIAWPLTLDSTASLPRIVKFAPEAPRSRVELLGSQVIEGLVVEGARISTPDPLLAGNDQVEERWFSEELGEVIVMKRSGQVVWRLGGMDRSEPDPSLFRVPVNYTIEDTPDYGDVPSPVNSR